jgi:hypothetical protein
MAYTLVEASKLSNDVLSQGIVETFVREDPILERIKWIDIPGNALKYDRETTEATADFKNVNDNWVPTFQKVTPYTATLKIMGNAARLDDFIKTTRSNINDVKKELIQGNIKAVKKLFMDTFWYGSETTDPKSFDGCHVLIADTTYNTINVDANDSADHALALNSMLDKALDMPKGFKPSMIVSTRQMRRNVTKYLRSVGSIQTDRDEFSRQVMRYGSDGIPWYVSDYLLDTELTSGGVFSAKTGGFTTSIFILTFDPKGLQGCQARAMEGTPWIMVPGTNCEESLIRWYPSLMMKSLVSCVKITGLDADGTVVA